MGKDEPVDGAKVAAAILNNMRASQREKLLTRIQGASPDAAKKIHKNLLSFEDVKQLTGQGIQLLLKECDHKDLLLSLKLCTPEVKEILYANMTARKKDVVQEDFAALPPTPRIEAEEAQKRVVQLMDRLRTEGRIKTQGGDDELV